MTPRLGPVLRRRGGFLTMTPERLREVSALGLAARRALGRPGHRWTSDEASAAGIRSRRRHVQRKGCVDAALTGERKGS